MATTAPMAPRRAPPSNTRQKLGRKSASTYSTVCDLDCLDVSNAGETCESPTREGQSSIRGCKLGDISPGKYDRDRLVRSGITGENCRRNASLTNKMPDLRWERSKLQVLVKCVSLSRGGNRNFTSLFFLFFIPFSRGQIQQRYESVWKKDKRDRSERATRKRWSSSDTCVQCVFYARRNGGFASTLMRFLRSTVVTPFHLHDCNCLI